MNIKELKKLLEKIPDNYEIRIRSENSILDDNKIPLNLYFSGHIKEIKPIHSFRTLMIVGN